MNADNNASADKTRNAYDRAYRGTNYYWGVRPSDSCFEALHLLPPDRPLRVLDIGCGEGRNAVFFARNGYHVSAFDFSPEGVRKTRELAQAAGVEVDAFEADINTFRLCAPFDILFSTGTLHCLRPELRAEVFDNYRAHTRPSGLHIFNVFVDKPFIAPAPDADSNGTLWKTGELFAFYADWKLESCGEDIFDCMSSGLAHKHCCDRVTARKMVE